MLDIKPSLDFNRIEAGQRWLADYSDDTQLRVTTDLKNWRVGGEAALIHLIANWAVRFDKPQLVLYAKTPKEASTQVLNLSAKHHGRVALLAASHILLEDRKALPPELERKLFEDVVKSAYPPPGSKGPEGLETPKNWRGERVLFLCSHRRNQECPFPLYHVAEGQEPLVKNPDDFADLFKKVINSALYNYRLLSSPTEEIKTQIGEIIYELFKNTHEHARFDIRGDRIYNSLRGITAALHVTYGLNELRLAEGRKDSPVTKYLSSFGRSEGGREQAFLELNVFDNGPGLASNWLGKPLSEASIKQEWDAVQACWGKWATTSDRPSKGLGLYRVAQTLTESRGFLRLRTGRLSLYRDFSDRPYPDGSIDPPEDLFSPKKLMLMDFESGLAAFERISRLTACDGLLLTMLIPINFKAEEAQPLR